MEKKPERARRWWRRADRAVGAPGAWDDWKNLVASKAVSLVAAPVAAFFAFVVAVMGGWRWWEVVIFVILWAWAAVALWFGFEAWWQERKARNIKKQLPVLLPDIEALADGLAAELKGEASPSTVARNRATMRRIVRLFLANEIAAPVANEPPRQHFADWLSGWLMFATTLAARVGGDDYETLTDLYQEVRTVLKQQVEARGTSTALLAQLSE